MSRLTSGIYLSCILVGCVFLSACSTSKTTTVIVEPVPASVDLCPSPSSNCTGGINISLEVGQTQGVTATARNNRNQVLTETFSFQSSNPAVLTIATNGAVCAGTWNSLTVPQVCTPGPTGVAQLTATTQGVSSPPVTVYVHQHITRVTISKVPNQPATLSTACFSKGAPSGPESALYQAFAFNGTADITSSVGPFSWQAVLLGGQTTSAVALSSPPTGAPLNQEIATANTPGISLFFTSASGTHSLPLQFETCPVQSISIKALGNPATSFVVNTGTSTALNATVTDSLGMTLVGVPLTWSSTNPISVSASGATSTTYGSVGTASGSAIGAGAVIASCTPPACNGGISPSLPIYPREAISFTVRSTSNPTSPTAYVTSTGCGTTTTAACTPTIVPISRTSSTTPFAAGNPVSIPFAPNSILFDDRGSLAYLGVDSSAFGTKTLATFTGSSASLATNIAGKVLAISPDTTSVIVSNTADVPNQVFVCSNCSGSGRSVASFLITGATAAAFSPDSLKAYIVAGNNLYVYSKADPLRTIPLTAPATDVAFFPEGAFGYLAGGVSSAVTVRRTCDSALVDSVTTTATPSMIRALPDAATVVALEPPNSPNLELINVSPNGLWDGCTPLVNDAVSNTFNLGLGNFTPTQFIISADGSAAYILGLQPPPNASLPFSFIIVFNFATQTPSVISLTGNAVPLTASLSPAGNFLFVGADDGAVHIIDTATQTDTQQITFPYPTNALCYGPGTPATQSPVTCLPDLVAVRP
jgi:trimeric autotransporter adhesin